MRRTLDQYINYYLPIMESLCSEFRDLESFEYLPSCIANSIEKEFYKYMKKILKLKNYKDVINGIFDRLSCSDKVEFITEIDGSDLDIFVDWYLELLDKCLSLKTDNPNDKEYLLYKRAKDIYEFYEDSFKEVGDKKENK